MEDHPQGNSAPTSGVGEYITSVFDSVKDVVNEFVDSVNSSNFAARQKVEETIECLEGSSKGSPEGTGTGTGTRNVDEGNPYVSRESTTGGTIGELFKSFTDPIEKARLEARAALDGLMGNWDTGVSTPSGRGGFQDSREGTGTETGTRTEDEGHPFDMRESPAIGQVRDTLQEITGPIEKGRLEARAALDGLAGKRNTGINSSSDAADF